MAYDKELYLGILRREWGYKDFRGIQSEIIESIADGRDTLGLMPTGGGKSITFQVPALAEEGVCIVVTPLIALMKDQVEHLRHRGIAAAAIYSGMTRREIITSLENCILGDIKLLYISPERIASDLFQTKLRRINVSFITVDEAHCISQWGYDFRPSYLHIADIRRMKPQAPVLALTATATPQVIDDIQEKLGFRQKNVFKMSFERKNLAYIVRKTEDKLGQTVHILSCVKGSAIVYVRSRKRAAELCRYLEEKNQNATFYHAGLEHSVKDEHQKAWHDDQKRIMVATNAFGMGIDKPDVRIVIHYDCPSSIEAYFQEAGRAGRDGAKAYAVLLYNDSDQRKLKKRIADEFPEKQTIRDIYDQLAYFYQIGIGSGRGHTFAFDIDKFCVTYRHFPIQVNSALRILQRAGYIDYDMEPDASARLMFLLERSQLDRLNNLSPKEEAVVTTLLRNYGGLFTDYQYIDESLVARLSGLTVQQVYLILRGLTQRRIAHFIPLRKMPYITYTVERREGKSLLIPKEVYEQRQKQFVKRIESVINYAKNDNVCRSRQLLRYFGETESEDCGQCDVCIEHNGKDPETEKTDEAKAKICELLADHKEHHVSELASLHIPKAYLDNAVSYLIHEELVMCRSSYLFIKK